MRVEKGGKDPKIKCREKSNGIHVTWKQGKPSRSGREPARRRQKDGKEEWGG